MKCDGENLELRNNIRRTTTTNKWLPPVPPSSTFFATSINRPTIRWLLVMPPQRRAANKKPKEGDAPAGVPSTPYNLRSNRIPKTNGKSSMRGVRCDSDLMIHSAPRVKSPVGGPKNVGGRTSKVHLHWQLQRSRLIFSSKFKSPEKCLQKMV